MDKKMKILFVVVILCELLSSNLYAESLRYSSISFDPFTFIGIVGSLLVLSNDEYIELGLNNLWFDMDLNWKTNKQRELGTGIFLGTHRISIKTQYRSFYNKERQSGFFGGFYGLIEWRRMYWHFTKNNELAIGWSLPFNTRENIYHTIGITGGVDIGFRIRINNFGITPYLGLGIPLYFTFGNLPPKKNNQEFQLLNIGTRAINIGLKLDFFNH